MSFIPLESVFFSEGYKSRFLSFFNKIPFSCMTRAEKSQTKGLMHIKKSQYLYIVEVIEISRIYKIFCMHSIQKQM